MNKKFLVSGGDGQLACSFKNIQENYKWADFVFLNKTELDISLKENIQNVVKYYKPDYFINCAAYTSVDKAESEKDKTYLINHIAVKNIAEVCSKNNISLIHYSTDFVFQGNSIKPYQENDITNPLNIYGKSKLAGEISINNQANLNYIILRTSWVYAEHGNNFVKTMLRLFDSKDEIGVVDDQYGAPTYALNIAECTLKLIEMDFINRNTLHFSNGGNISWYDFACEIKKIISNDIKITPITTKEYPTPAIRPKYSVMNLSKIKSLGINIDDWKLSLKDCLNKL